MTSVKSESVLFRDKAPVIASLGIVRDEATSQADRHDAVNRLTLLISKYYEQPELLDPHLEDMIAPCMETLRQLLSVRYRDAAAASGLGEVQGQGALKLRLLRDGRAHAICRAMHVLCNTRGHKTVAKFLPHEIADLEPCIHALLSCDRADKDRWHTPYMLLLWLSVLVLVPFGLESANSSLIPALASHAGAAGNAGLYDVLGDAAMRTTELYAGVRYAAGADDCAQRAESLVGAIESACRSFLADASTVRGVAALAISRLMSRPDMAGARLQGYCTWAARAVAVATETAKGRPPVGSEAYACALSCYSAMDSSDTTGHTLVASAVSRASFLLQGVLRSAVLVAKHSHRDALMQGSAIVGLFNAIVRASGSDAAGDGAAGASTGSGPGGSAASNAGGPAAEARSRVSVLKQSSTLRKLVVKLAQRTALAQLPPRIVSWRYSRGKRSLMGGDGTSTDAASGARSSEAVLSAHVPPEDDGPEDVPEVVEVIVDELLHGLRDRDTVVRWSAAKGVGRITGRLGRVLADDVVAAVLDLLVPEESDSAWHGGCLALAELARRGLLLPSRLPDVVPLVCRALLFDVRRGAASVGSHVRDAACYVCWAFARAYDPSVMRPYVPDLARGMLLTALFDREINCRRAASAAYQENVGRQGSYNFPAGIDILTAADYYSLGNRANAFSHVACKVARADPSLLDTMIHHLLQNRLRHWDVGVRENAADALAMLSCEHPSRGCSIVLAALIPYVTSPDHLERHGAMLGCARVLYALAVSLPTLKMYLVAEQVSSIRMIIPRAERARAYTGRGGEKVREAACEVVQASLLASIPFSKKGALRILYTIRECLKHPQETVQQAALKALHLLASRNFAKPGDIEARLRLAGQFAGESISNENPAVRRGAALALGCLPIAVFADAEGPMPASTQPTKAAAGKRQPSWALPPSVPLKLESACRSSGALCLDVVLAALVQSSRQEARASRRDAETRRNACTSLACLVESLGLSSTPSDTGGTCNGLTQGQLDGVVYALLAASGDYAMDTRGDVGSWVRIAASRALERVVRVCLAAGIRMSAGLPTSRGAVDYSAPHQLLVALGIDGMSSFEGSPLDRLRQHQWPALGEVVLHAEWGRGEVERIMAGGRMVQLVFRDYGPTASSPGCFAFPYRRVVVRVADVLPVRYGSGANNARWDSDKDCADCEETIEDLSECVRDAAEHGALVPSPSSVPTLRRSHMIALFGALLRLASERLDSVRDAAATSLAQLLHDRVLGVSLDRFGLYMVGSLRRAVHTSSTTAGELLAEAWRLRKTASLVEDEDEVEEGSSQAQLSTSGEMLALQPLSGQAVGVNYSVPYSCFGRLTPLLAASEISTDLLEGLSMSIGGMTESTARASEQAVVEWCYKQRRTRPTGLGGGESPTASLLRVAYGINAFLRGRLDANAGLQQAAGPGSGEIEEGAGDASHAQGQAREMGHDHAAQGDDLSSFKVKKRMIVPVLRTAHALLSRACLDVVMVAEPQWTAYLLKLVRFRCMRSTEVQRLMAATDVFLDLCASPAPGCKGALQSALDLLGHEFPKVRRVMAERAYSKTLELQDHLEAVALGGPGGGMPSAEPACDLNAALEVLSETEWDGDADAAINSRDSLYVHFGVAMPSLRVGILRSDGTRLGWPSSSTNDSSGADDHATYLALVREVGY